MSNAAWHALSPLDGRYRKFVKPLAEIFSERALICRRLQIELKYFLYLSKEKIAPVLSPKELALIQELVMICDISNLSVEKSRVQEKIVDEVKKHEQRFNHDVKAVEYFLKEFWQKNDLPGESFLHFGLTSEDINNIALGLSVKKALDEVLLPSLENLVNQLAELGAQYKSSVMLARTHGQPAVPTTFGKEIIVFADRLFRSLNELKKIQIEAKLSGAVGNHNALLTALPNQDWLKLSQRFIKSFDLEARQLTTQSLPADNLVRVAQHLQHLNGIILDLTQDFWQYCSLGYCQLKQSREQIGSSTMPQKVNPINFENAEGNLGLANSLLSYFIQKLPVSRLQRDLSDSTVKRNIGTAFGYCLIAYKACSRGLAQITADEKMMKNDLNSHWEVVTEGLQTVLRMHGIADSYEQLREFSQGEKVTEQDILLFIDNLKVAEKVKNKLRSITPSTYLGEASNLVDYFLERYRYEKN